MYDVTVELNTVKDLVIKVLKEVPESRSNDTLLYLECCKLLGATTVEDMEDLNLSIISVHKMRQRIQNKDLMLRPSEEMIALRKQRSHSVREYMVRKTS